MSTSGHLNAMADVGSSVSRRRHFPGPRASRPHLSRVGDHLRAPCRWRFGWVSHVDLKRATCSPGARHAGIEPSRRLPSHAATLALRSARPPVLNRGHLAKARCISAARRVDSSDKPTCRWATALMALLPASSWSPPAAGLANGSVLGRACSWLQPGAHAPEAARVNASCASPPIRRRSRCG
jgi:hypothetical protein